MKNWLPCIFLDWVKLRQFQRLEVQGRPRIDRDRLAVVDACVGGDHTERVTVLDRHPAFIDVDVAVEGGVRRRDDEVAIAELRQVPR